MAGMLPLWALKMKDKLSPPPAATLNARLLQAQQRGLEGHVRYLLDKGADANIQGTGNYALLIDAANACQPGIIEALLEHGANVDAKGPDGTTALMCSADQGDLRSATVLMKFNADIHCKNAFNKNAFDYAAEADNWNATLEWKLKIRMQLAANAAGGTVQTPAETASAPARRLQL